MSPRDAREILAEMDAEERKPESSPVWIPARGLRHKDGKFCDKAWHTCATAEGPPTPVAAVVVVRCSECSVVYARCAACEKAPSNAAACMRAHRFARHRTNWALRKRVLPNKDFR